MSVAPDTLARYQADRKRIEDRLAYYKSNMSDECTADTHRCTGFVPGVKRAPFCTCWCHQHQEIVSREEAIAIVRQSLRDIDALDAL